MPTILFRVLIAGIGLVLNAGCAHNQAVRVDCEGSLRPINRPMPSGKQETGTSGKRGDAVGGNDGTHGQN
jgi:hypothetical protein